MNTTIKNVATFDVAKHTMYGNILRFKGLTTR